MQSGIRFGVAGSNMEMWKTGCTVQRLSGSHRVTEWVQELSDILWTKEYLTVLGTHSVTL